MLVTMVVDEGEESVVTGGIPTCVEMEAERVGVEKGGREGEVLTHSCKHVHHDDVVMEGNRWWEGRGRSLRLGREWRKERKGAHTHLKKNIYTHITHTTHIGEI